MKRPALREIAEIAGVSIPTVSLVLSGKRRISTAVRYKVVSAADDTGSLRNRHKVGSDELSSRNIGMLCRFEAYRPHVQPFLEPLLSTIDEVLKINRHYLSLIPLTRTMSTEELLERILRDGLKAIISVNFSDLALFERLEKVGIPVVVIGDIQHQDRFCTVGVDDFQGSYDATKYLIGLGHKRISYVDYPKEEQPMLVEYRHFGYQKALTESGIDADSCYHVRVSDNEDDLLAKRVVELFTMTPKPTAIFGHDDYFKIKERLVDRGSCRCPRTADPRITMQ